MVTAIRQTVAGKPASAPEPAVQPISNPLTQIEAPADGLPSTDLTNRPAGSIPARSSRFFPSATEQPKRQVIEAEPRTPSPPPPEEVSSHPVYFGNSSRPNVHLPIPKPVVKLPPKAVSAPAPAPTFASMAAAPPKSAMQQSSTAISWQEKINSLFKPTLPEKKNVLAVTPSTKEALHVLSAAVSVSIPQTKFGLQKGDGDIAVEQVEQQDAMFEDRELGSLPAVRVPAMAPANAWFHPTPLRQLRKTVRPVHAHSMQPFFIEMLDYDNNGNVRAPVRLPGAIEPRVFLLPRKSASTRPRVSNSVRPRKGNSKPAEASGGGFKKSTSTSGTRQPSNKTSWSSARQTSH